MINITPQKLEKLIINNDCINIIDVRNEKQKKTNPLKSIKTKETIFKKINVSDLKNNTVLICQFGIETERFIVDKKLSNVFNLIGGALAWNYYISKGKDISRYNRQMILSQVGEIGQKKIKFKFFPWMNL